MSISCKKSSGIYKRARTNKCNKATGYKVNLQKTFLFQYTTTNQFETDN